MSGIVEFRIKKKMQSQVQDLRQGQKFDYVIANFHGYMEALEGGGLVTENERREIIGWYIREIVKFQNRQNQGRARQTAAV